MTGGRKAYYRCCVPKCGQTSTSAPELCFHRIVREASRRLMWLANMHCGEADLLCSSRICGDHFTYYDYEDFDANRLRKFAVPTLFAWEPTYTCQDVREAPPSTASATSASAANAADTIEIQDDDDEDEEDAGAEPCAGDAASSRADSAEAGGGAKAAMTDAEQSEYDQLLLLVSVSERLEATQATISAELAKMRRVQLGQDRLLDSVLAAVMRPDFPLALSEADIAQLLTLRAAATVGCGSGSGSEQAGTSVPAASATAAVASAAAPAQLPRRRLRLRLRQRRRRRLLPRRGDTSEDEDGDYDDEEEMDAEDDPHDADYNAEVDAV